MRIRFTLVVLALLLTLLALAPAAAAAPNNPDDPEAYLANDDEMTGFGYWHDRSYDRWSDSIDIRFRGRAYRSAFNATTMNLAVSLNSTDALAYAVYSSVVGQLNAEGWLVDHAAPGRLPRNEHFVIGYRTLMDGSEDLVAVHRVGRVVGMTMMGGPVGSADIDMVGAVHSYFVVRARG